MRVRLPTPHAGWQAFATEVVIVVLGVLIALGLQQLVNNLSDRAAALRARSDIRDEIGHNLGRLQQRQQTQRCIDRRLDQIGLHLDRLSKSDVQPAPQWIGRPIYAGLIDDRWQVASQSGHASLLSPEEQRVFTTINDIARAIEPAQEEEQRLWAQLRALEGADQLTDEAIFSMRSVLSQARYANWRIKLGITQMFDRTRPVGIKPIFSTRGSRSICIPMNTPRAIALTKTETPYGEP